MPPFFFTPLFAFFLTPAMTVWGIVLGSIPIVIHLLHKRKYRESPWAAMRFLLEAARKNSRRLRLEQLLLLLVRTLLLLFLVGALRGFYFETTSQEFESDGPTHHIIVVDVTFSMRHRPDKGPSRYEEARQIAVKIVDDARPRDLFNLLLITGHSKRTVIAAPARSQEWVRNRIIGARAEKTVRSTPSGNSLTPGVMPRIATEEHGRLLPTLADIHRLLKNSDVKRKQIYFISDFQKATWSPGSQDVRKQIRTSMKSASEQASLYLIDVGDPRAVNTAITAFASKDPDAIVQKSVELVGTIRNFSARKLHQRTLDLYVDGHKRLSTTVDLEANSQTPFRFFYPEKMPLPQAEDNGSPALESQFELKAGEHYFEVRLQNDSLPLDNVRGLSLPVKTELKALLVSGRSGQSDDNAAYYLNIALRPNAKARRWKGMIRPTTINEAELMGTDLSLYDCVFLCNVGFFRPDEARKLQTFAENGGGLVFCLGDRVKADNYNAVLYRGGNGVLPAKILKKAVEKYQFDDRAVSFDFQAEGVKLTHPIVNPFKGNDDAGLKSVVSIQYFQVERSQTLPSRVALRFEYKKTMKDRLGDPVILECSIGQGRAVLVTTSIDRRWSSWPANPSFPPLMIEIGRFAVSGRWNRRQHLVGDVLERGFPVSADDIPESISIKLPDSGTSEGVTASVPLANSPRWRTGRHGADFYEQRPLEADASKNAPAGRIASRFPVSLLERRRRFSLAKWRGKSGWVHNQDLERIGYPSLFFLDTLKSGPYTIMLDPTRATTEKQHDKRRNSFSLNEIHAFNVDPRESDITPVTEAALRADTLSGVPFQYRRQWRGENLPYYIARTRQNSLTRWLLIAGLCLILVEQLMAWKFFPGLFLLLVFIGAEFSRRAFAANPFTGAATSAAVIALLAAFFFVMRRRHLTRRERRMKPL
ncbi:MAG: BatA domain-containing protein [Planctomycetes bacterium]|nr:BatA domain-containing protein [Planctomycetota bacterium]